MGIRASAIPIAVATKYRRQDNGLKERAGFGPEIILPSLTGTIPTRRKHDSDATKQMENGHRDRSPPSLLDRTDDPARTRGGIT
jgi:hypothetical protein